MQRTKDGAGPGNWLFAKRKGVEEFMERTLLNTMLHTTRLLIYVGCLMVGPVILKLFNGFTKL
jgi:hypothetical protein